MQKIDEILQDKAFDCFDNERKALIKKMYAEMEGKTTEGVLMVFQKYSRSLFAGGRITPEQRDAMLRVLTADMSPTDKNKLNTILKLLGM